MPDTLFFLLFYPTFNRTMKGIGQEQYFISPSKNVKMILKGYAYKVKQALVLP